MKKDNYIPIEEEEKKRGEEYWKGFDLACALLEDLGYDKYSSHPYNIADCLKSKVNRLPKKKIRVNKALSPQPSQEEKTERGAEAHPFDLDFYQPLFDHMYDEHRLTLLQSEMDEIIRVVQKLVSPSQGTEKGAEEAILVFATWYSGMSKEKVKKAYSRYLVETNEK